jgi:hypothetical protein
MQIFGTIYVMISLLIIFVPMFACTWPEEFTHNVNLEFIADTIFEAKLRVGNRMREQLKKTGTLSLNDLQ